MPPNFRSIICIRKYCYKWTLPTLSYTDSDWFKLFRVHFLFNPDNWIHNYLITTKVVSLNPAHGEMYSIQHYVIKFIGDLRQFLLCIQYFC